MGKDQIQQESSRIYWCRCSKLDCNVEHMIESPRTFGERFKGPLPIYGYQSTTETSPHWTTSSLWEGGQSFDIPIKESIYKKVNSPILNTDIGTYNLPQYGWSSSQHSRTPNQEPARTSTSTSTQNCNYKRHKQH